LFSGDSLEINGEIKGDLIVWSGRVIVNGRIDGSILGAVWDKLVINGEVLGHVRGLANEMRVNGKVDGSITTASAVFNTSSHSLIGKGLLGIFSKLDLRGTVNGPVDVKSVPLTQISGRINGNIKAQGVPVTWQAPLEINGTINDYSGVTNDPSKIKGITLKGKYFLHQPQESNSDSSGVIRLISIVWFIGSLLASLILYRLFPRTLWTITEPTSGNFRRSIISGLVSIIGIPILMLILVLTVVGIPLAVLLGLVYGMLLFFFGIPINLWFGRLIFKSRFHPSLMIIFAGILLMLISFIPVINMAFLLVFLLLGSGMMIGNIRPQINEQRKVDLKI